jgi:hypothetical protein
MILVVSQGMIVVDYDCKSTEDKMEMLRSRAIEDDVVGAVAPLNLIENRGDRVMETEYAIVTCIIRYESAPHSNVTPARSQTTIKRCYSDEGEDVDVKRKKKTVKLARKKG